MKVRPRLLWISGLLVLGLIALFLPAGGGSGGTGSEIPAGDQGGGEAAETQGIAIWQGYEHHWTYNHRLNRLGDYVRTVRESPDKVAVLDTHTGATGIGDDEGTYQSSYAFLRVNGLHALQQEISFHFQNQRGVASRQIRQFTIPWEGAPAQPRVVAFINGYDLIANRSAFKLQTLQMTVSHPQYNPETRQVTCQVSASLNMRCRSLECKKFAPEYDYTLRVQVLVLMGDQTMHAVEKHYQQLYRWDRKAEPRVRPQADTLRGVGNRVYPNAVLGFRSLSVLLNREHWFIDIGSVISPGRYQPATGLYPFDLNLFFKAWKQGMRRHSADRLDSQFSFREKGSAVLLATVTLLQLPDGCVSNHTISGQIIWRGKGRNPRTAAAVRTDTTRFNSDCTERE